MLNVIVTLSLIFGFLSCGSFVTKDGISSEGVKEGEKGEVAGLESDGESHSETKHDKNGESDFLSQLKLVEGKMRESGKNYLTFFTSDLYLKASRAAIDGNLALALTIFKYLHQLYPEDGFLEKRYAITLIRVGQISESVPILVKAYKKSQYRDEKIGLLLAGVYGAKLEKRKAQKIYQQVLKNNPSSEDACLLLSKHYFDAKNLKRSFAVLTRCEKALGKKCYFSYQKGVMHQALGNNKKAIKYFKESIRYYPENFMAFAELGGIYEEEKNFKQALKVYQAFFDFDPSNREVTNKIVKLLFGQNKFKESLPYLEVLSELESDNLNIKMKLGMIYVETDKHKEAKRVFHEILKEVPRSDKVLYYLGSVYTLTRELEKAVYIFRKIDKRSPFYNQSALQVVKNLSYMVRQDNEYEDDFFEAIFNYENIPEISLPIRMIQASYYEMNGELQKAIDVVLNSKKLKGHKEDHDYYLATLYEKKGDSKESREIVKTIVKVNPKNAQAWNFLGYSILEDEKGNIEEAYSHIKKALSLDPNDAFIRDSLGWYYFKKGFYTKALKEVLFAQKKIGNDFVIFKHLSLIYRALNKDELAKRYYIKAVQMEPTEEGKNELAQEFANVHSQKKSKSSSLEE